MEAPRRLPQLEAHLADWAVYADWLQTRGDPRGDAIAAELALPEAPDRAQLAAFRAALGQLHPPRDVGLEACCLSHVHTFSVEVTDGAVRDAPTLERARAHELLASEHGARLEEVQSIHATYDGSPAWRTFFRALPSSCRRVHLAIAAWTGPPADVLLEALPETVRELALNHLRGKEPPAPELLVDDRFDVVDLTWTWLDRALAERLRAALARSRAVRIRLGSIDRDTALPAGRWELGQAGDAALLDLHARRAHRLGRWSLLERHRSHGPLPVRAHLAASLSEMHALQRAHGISSDAGVGLIRTGDLWRLYLENTGPIVLRGDALDPDALDPDDDIPIADGDRFQIGQREYELVTRDVPRRVADLLAT